MQDCADHAYTRLNAMLAGKNTSEIFEADHQANRSMAAHAKVSNIIEEDDTGGAGRVYRFTQQSSDDHIGAARLIYDCRSEGVVLGAKAFLPFRERAGAQVGAATHDQSGGLAAGVGINDSDPLALLSSHPVCCHPLLVLVPV
jgi:hypothetical protein